MRKYVILLLLAAAASGSAVPAVAHDMWLMPVATEDGGQDVVARIGHAGEDQAWGPAPHKLVSVVEVTGAPDGGVRLRDRAADAVEGEFRIGIRAEAPTVLAVVSVPTLITLEPGKFDDYARDAGLRLVLEDRLQDREEAAEPGRESYSRRGKVLLGAGLAEMPEVFATPLGHTLEIVPEGMRDGQARFRVHHRGEPLEGARVRLQNLDMNVGDVRSATSDADGRVSFALPPGRWALHTIWGEPVDGMEAYRYSTVFASLGFAVGR